MSRELQTTTTILDRLRRWWLLATLAIFVAAASTVRPSTATPAGNRVPIVMRTPHGGFNRIVLTIMVCAPGTRRCATIDNVMIDTGSTGLRLEASAVPGWLRLPPHTGPDGKPLGECTLFVHDRAWGPLYRADLHIGGLSAPDLPIQVFDNAALPAPAACPPSHVTPTSNGTLGIGPYLHDCLDACETVPPFPPIFACAPNACSGIEKPLDRAYRLPNPVSRFGTHQNGVVFAFPAEPPGGSTELAGTLTFGVGTDANNQLGGARILKLDAAGRFTSDYGGEMYPGSTIDSGTESYVIADHRLPICADMPWAFCVTPARRLGAAMIGADGARLPVSFTVGDYRDAIARKLGSSPVATVSEPGARGLVWGAPFFIGRRVALVFERREVPGEHGLAGPFYAFPADPIP